MEKKSVGELKMRIMDDVDSLGNFIREQVVNYISGILLVITALYMSFCISINMTLYCIGIIPIVFFIKKEGIIMISCKKLFTKRKVLSIIISVFSLII